MRWPKFRGICSNIGPIQPGIGLCQLWARLALVTWLVTTFQARNLASVAAAKLASNFLSLEIDAAGT